MNVNKENEEVLRGHFDECLRHLGTKIASSVPKGSQRATQVKQPIADFCGVKLDTVSRWLSGSISSPVGEPLIKLMNYLDMTGYRVIELERMPKVKRNFMELIGYGLLTSDQAAEFLGYSTTSTLYQVFQGHEGTSEEKEQRMWNAWKEKRDELQQQKEKLQELYRLDIPLHKKAETKTSAPKMPSRPKAVTSIMDGLLILLEENGLSESDLKQSADTVLRLSARLSALSSSLIMSEQRKGENQWEVSKTTKLS